MQCNAAVSFKEHFIKSSGSSIQLRMLEKQPGANDE